MVHQESYLSNVNIGNETSISEISTVCGSECIVMEKLDPRKVFSTGSTLFCIKLEYWMEALQ